MRLFSRPPVVAVSRHLDIVAFFIGACRILLDNRLRVGEIDTGAEEEIDTGAEEEIDTVVSRSCGYVANGESGRKRGKLLELKSHVESFNTHT